MSATTSVRTSVFGVRPPIVRQPPTSRRLAGSLAPLAVIVLCVSMLLASSPAYAAQEPVGLGTAESFAILAGSGITNTGPTTITGDIGTFPTPTESGFGSITLIGTNHAGDAVTAGAKDDLVTAYNDAAGRTPATDQAVELGGKTLKAGVYKSGTFGLTGTLTLDAEGNTDATFIFQAATTLIAETNSRMVLLNGVDPCRVVWQVGSSATFKVGTRFVGDVLALTSITAQTGATFEGRFEQPRSGSDINRRAPGDRRDADADRRRARPDRPPRRAWNAERHPRRSGWASGRATSRRPGYAFGSAVPGADRADDPRTLGGGGRVPVPRRLRPRGRTARTQTPDRLAVRELLGCGSSNDNPDDPSPRGQTDITIARQASRHTTEKTLTGWATPFRATVRSSLVGTGTARQSSVEALGRISPPSASAPRPAVPLPALRRGRSRLAHCSTCSDAVRPRD
jgi:hypothetical protein